MLRHEEKIRPLSKTNGKSYGRSTKSGSEKASESNRNSLIMPGAVLYARVSTLEQANSNNSIPIQTAKFQAFCASNSPPQLEVFIDKQSARTADKRPHFQEMLEYCRKKHKNISCVVVADLSSLARNVVDQGSSIAELKKLNIKTVGIDEPMVDDTAAGKLAGNIFATFNQFFSDNLSEKTKFRMAAAVREGRFVWPSPIGYLNVDKNLVVDSERAPLVRKAFELFASGAYSGDGVLRFVTAMGLITKKGSPLTKQSFARMLQNEIYAGWIVSGENRVRGKHVALVSEAVFQAVQDRLNGKSRPHKQLSEDFPLRGFVKCIQCGRNLTAGWAKGRKERYPHYWCWTKECGAVKAGRDDMERHWLALLSKMRPTEELLEQLPLIAARQWETRKGRIAKDVPRRF